MTVEPEIDKIADVLAQVARDCNRYGEGETIATQCSALCQLGMLLSRRTEPAVPGKPGRPAQLHAISKLEANLAETMLPGMQRQSLNKTARLIRDLLAAFNINPHASTDGIRARIRNIPSRRLRFRGWEIPPEYRYDPDKALGAFKRLRKAERDEIAEIERGLDLILCERNRYRHPRYKALRA